LALEQAQLGRPSGGFRLHGEYSIPQGHRRGVLGDVFADEPGPPAEHLTAGELLGPATLGGQPGGEPAEGLRVPIVGSGTGPAPTPA
jgi:hypothetical protein